MKTAGTLAALVAAAVLGLVGCGGEDEQSATTEGTGSAAAQTIEIRETEFALDPANVTVDAAGTVTLRAVNGGSIDHALEIEGKGLEEETETIGAGESAEVTVALQEGTYELYCPIGNHRDQGMEGTLVVGAGGATTTDGETETRETDTGETETGGGEDDDGGSGSNYGSGEGYG